MTPVHAAAGDRRIFLALLIGAGIVVTAIGGVFLLQVFVQPGNTPPAPQLTDTVPSSTLSPVSGSIVPISATQSPGSPDSIGNVTRGSREVPVVDATELASRVHERVNHARQEHGLSDLRMDAALGSIARAHSSDMASHRYFGHINLQERDATARGAAAGYTCHKSSDPFFSYAITENLYATYPDYYLITGNSTMIAPGQDTEDAIARETVDAWMNSPGHRENILDTGVDREGIGVALAEYGLVFVTEDFC